MVRDVRCGLRKPFFQPNDDGDRGLWFYWSHSSTETKTDYCWKLFGVGHLLFRRRAVRGAPNAGSRISLFNMVVAKAWADCAWLARARRPNSDSYASVENRHISFPMAHCTELDERLSDFSAILPNDLFPSRCSGGGPSWTGHSRIRHAN